MNNVSDCMHVLWPWYKSRHAKTKLTRNETFSSVTAVVGALIDNVEIKNIKLAGCCGSLAQLQRKLLQHLDYMWLDTCILLQTIRKDHVYSIVFFFGGPQVFYLE